MSSFIAMETESGKMNMKKIKFNIFLLLFLLAPFSSLFADKISLSGSIYSAETGKPVKNAILSFENLPFIIQSDLSGKFYINDSINSRIFNANSALAINKKIYLKGSELKWAKEVDLNEISIYSLNGRRLFHRTINSEMFNIKLPKFSKSIVVLAMKIGNKKYSEKMIFGGNYQFDFGFLTSEIRKRQNTKSIIMKISHNDYITKKISVKLDSDNIAIYLSKSPAAEVFSQNSVHTYSVNIDTSVFDSLEKNAREEFYVPCTLSFNGSPIGIVGIRYQGSDYHHNLYFDENGKTGIAPKISFKFKFDEYEPNKRFSGLKRLILNAMDTDATCIRNKLSYTLFNEMGIYSCRTAYGRLEINGKYEGLFLVLEPVDGEFLDNRFCGYGDGNLYKEVWPGNTVKDWAMENLKTKEYVGNVNRMLEFDSAITDMTLDNFVNEIEEWSDLDYILRFLAVDRAVIAIDGIMTWYVMGKFYGNHNYYWYEENKVDGKFYLLPWDYDATFYVPDGLFDIAEMPRWNEEPVTDTFSIFGDGQVICPSADKFIYMLGQTSWNQYVDIATKFLNNQFSKNNLSDKITKWRDLIDPHLKDDPNLWQTYNGWSNAIESFIESIDFYRIRYEKILEGPDDFIIPDPDLTPSNNYNGLVIDDNNNFEFTSDLTTLPHIYNYTSEGSSSSIELNNQDPMSGNSDLKLATYFEPTPGIWSEWSGFSFETFQGAQDISNVERILITARSEKPVTVRINIESLAYPDPYGVKYGVFLSLKEKSKTFVIDPDMLFYPDWGSQANVKDEVLATFSGIVFAPDAAFTETGELLESDTVIFYIDDIRFIE